MKVNTILHSGAYLASAAMCFLVAQSVLATTPPPAGFIDASTYGGGYNTTDATAALQAAINTGQNVFVPKEASDWFVTPITLAKQQSGDPLRKRRDGHGQAGSVHRHWRLSFQRDGNAA